MSTPTDKPYHPETNLVQPDDLRSSADGRTEPLFLTQGFVYDSAEQCEARFKGDDPGFVYARFSNPTVAMFEHRMAMLEGAEAARATSTGMAAVTASLMGQLRAGDHVVATKTLFGSCRYVLEEHLPRFGVTSSLVDGTSIDEWKNAIRPNTKVFFLESPTNPTLDVIDIAAVAKVAHAANATVVVDNVYSTPLYQKPLALGADCVVYSAANYFDGQGHCLGGIILGSEKFIQTYIHMPLRQTGPSLSPFSAWTLLRGLETLTARLQRHTEVASTVADALAKHNKINRVIYPGRSDHPQADVARRQMSTGSTLVAFEIEGGKAAAFRFLDALRLVSISDDLGDSRSLITHPGTTTHQGFTSEQRTDLGIIDGLLRFSAGLEHPDDVVEDFLVGLATL
jgi:O-succinylhomoserine sulfhydrylase